MKWETLKRKNVLKLQSTRGVNKGRKIDIKPTNNLTVSDTETIEESTLWHRKLLTGGIKT